MVSTVIVGVVLSCRLRTPIYSGADSELQGTGTVPVPPELMMDVQEDFSKEYSVHDMLKLRDAMVQNPAIPKPITIDRFLEEMKKDPRATSMFSFFTAVYQSTSRQSGTPKHPRVILSTESGALTITFSAEKETGGPTLQNGMTLSSIPADPFAGVPGTVHQLENGDQIEVIQADPVSARKDFYQLFFPYPPTAKASSGSYNAGGSKGFLKNPSVCADCHNHTKAKSLTHLWGRYPIWNGVLGSMEDFISNQKGEFVRNQTLLVKRFGKEFDGPGNDCPDGEQKVTSTDATVDEYKILQNLRHLAKSGEPAYRHLDFPESAGPFYPFDDVPRGKFKNRPNFRLGALWHRLHIRNIVWEAKQTDFSKMKNLYLYGYFECSEAVGQDTEASMRQKFAREFGQATKYADIAKAQINGLKSSTYNSIAWMNAGLSFAGLTLHGLSIEYQNLSKFAYKSGYFPGGDTSERYLAAVLVKDDLQNEKAIPSNLYYWAKTPICNEKMGLNDYPYLRWFGFRPETDLKDKKAQLCQVLAGQLGVSSASSNQAPVQSK
jgi:hypothetical protein